MLGIHLILHVYPRAESWIWYGCPHLNHSFCLLTTPVVLLGNSGLKFSSIISGCMSYGARWIISDEQETFRHIKFASLSVEHSPPVVVLGTMTQSVMLVTTVVQLASAKLVRQYICNILTNYFRRTVHDRQSHTYCRTLASVDALRSYLPTCP